ncbi:MAG: DUF2061 domain-containing protein [Planctomycetes bacterium]|nr:DUF2061 domain-containing protein [Planctomycetota bacterium]
MKQAKTDSHYRSLAKALSWRVVATIITMSIAWGITGEKTIALEIGLADTAIKFFIFYGHERIWTRLKFGRDKAPEYEI